MHLNSLNRVLITVAYVRKAFLKNLVVYVLEHLGVIISLACVSILFRISINCILTRSFSKEVAHIIR